MSPKLQLPYLTVLLPLLLQIISTFKTFNILEENREIPPWTSYLYEEEEGMDDLTVREYVLQEQDQRTYLLCPRGFVIGQIGVALLLSKEQVEENPSLRAKQVTFRYMVDGLVVPSHMGDRIQPQDIEGVDMCPTLSRCLLYQACVFNFGNELCLQDPNPGTRKNINTNITCVRDQVIETHLRQTRVTVDVMEQFQRKKELVMNIMYDSKLDFGIEDFPNTVLTYREVSEQFVFQSSCPQIPDKAGFGGECMSVLGLDHRKVAQSTWHLTSRVKSVKCKEELVSVWCAFQYNREGKCVPPHLLRQREHQEEWFQTSVWSEAAYPRKGERPVEDMEATLQELEEYKYTNILPVRIAFAILVHKDVPAIMQLLVAIYRPYHYYVIHVDKRKDGVREELERQVRQSLPSFNVRILPLSRSFITSWGSNGIVRAQLEQFEELARMGVWDFLINMSGADLNLRDIDDLALALAPYRGHNFFAFHGNVRNKDLTQDQGLCWEAWYECEGFTYNISRTAGQPPSDVLEIKTTSQWATLSRELVEHLLDQESHTHIWRMYDFHMLTSVIPDESYLATFALNSPMKSKTHHVGLYWLKRFSGQTKYNLCKHLGDADFCGQGPEDIGLEDRTELVDMTHRYFFARKFSTADTKDSVRMLAAKMAGGEYYDKVDKYLPKQLVHQLMENAWRYLRLEQTVLTREAKEVKLSLTKLRILPVLHPSQPCCSLPFERHYKSIQEFSYIMDFTATIPEHTSVSMRAKYMVAPQCFCYPSGHLRAIRVTGWTEDGSDGKKALSINTPVPFHPAGSKQVFGELWFHTGNSSISPSCRATKTWMEGWHPATVDRLGRDRETGDPVGDTLILVANLMDPQGEVRCTQRLEVKWSKEDGVREDGQEKATFLTMSCGPIEAGLWHLEVKKDGVTRPYIYRVPLLFLPLEEEMQTLGDKPRLEEIDLLQGMWRIDSVSHLPLHDLYHDQDKLVQPFTPKDRRRHKKSSKTSPSHLSYSLSDWFVCWGGLVTLTLLLLSSYHCVYLPLTHPTRYHTRAMYPTLGLALTAFIVQSLLCWLYC